LSDYENAINGPNAKCMRLHLLIFEAFNLNKWAFAELHSSAQKRYARLRFEQTMGFVFVCVYIPPALIFYITL